MGQDNDVNIISPVLYGSSVPLAPFVASHLRAKKQNGILIVNLRIRAKIRWKVGTWTSGHYLHNLNYFAIIGFSSCCNGSPLYLADRLLYVGEPHRHFQQSDAGGTPQTIPAGQYLSRRFKVRLLLRRTSLPSFFPSAYYSRHHRTMYL